MTLNANFIKLISTNLFSKFADSMDNIIITLLVIDLTGSSTSTGIMLAITTIPGILFSLIGGTLSDMKDQKKIMSLMTISQAILLSLLAVLVKADRMTFIILCVILFILESFSRIYSPSFSSATLKVVSKAQYKEAVSLLNTTGSLIQMIGSSFCAVIVSFAGYVPALILNAISYLTSSIISMKIKISDPSISDKNQENMFTKIREGFAYILKHKTVLNLILLISSINFVLAWFDVAMPFLLTDHLNVPIGYLGYMKSASTLMFVLAGVFSMKVKIKKPKHVIAITIGCLGVSIGVIAFGNVLLAVIFWGAAAFFRTISSLLLMSQLGIQSDEDKIGRVMGFFMFVTSITMLISRVLSGYLVASFEAVGTFRLAGVILILLSLVTFSKRNDQNWAMA